MIKSIKKQGNGWLINDNKSVSSDKRNTDYQGVPAYIEEGGIAEEEVSWPI